eukprot:3318050-Amphidinium_carterae.1
MQSTSSTNNTTITLKMLKAKRGRRATWTRLSYSRLKSYLQAAKTRYCEQELGTVANTVGHACYVEDWPVVDSAGLFNNIRNKGDN